MDQDKELEVQTNVEIQGSPGRAILDFLIELIKVTAICASIIILVRWLLFQPFYVKGSSMEPSFFDGEYLIIYQLPYRFPERFHAFSEEDRGVSIIFHPPNDPSQFYIKRIIGLPGEHIKIEDGRIIITTQAGTSTVLKESYLDFGEITLPGTYRDVQLNLDEIYVLGDNRRASLDSRSIGPVPISNVVGKPMFRGWPLSRAGFVKKPTY